MDRKKDSYLLPITNTNRKRSVSDEIKFYEATEYLYNADKLTKCEKLMLPFLYRNNFQLPKRILKMYQNYVNKGGELIESKN